MCWEAGGAEGDATQASAAGVGGGWGEGDGVTEGFICQPSDTGVLWLNIFSPCHSRIRNHHKVGEHEYCP